MQRRDVIVTRAVALMDAGAHYLMDRNHVSSNPAMASVRGPLVMGLWVTLALALVGLVWGALVPIDSAAVARGSVVLLSSKKTVQHLEGGIIDEILVREGEMVKAGQALIRLNATAADASRDTLQAQLYTAQATEDRLIAEHDGLKDIAFSKEMLDAGKTNGDVAKAMAAQQRLFAAEQEAEQAKIEALGERAQQSRASIDGLKAQIEGASGQLDLLSEEISTVETLLAKGYATKTRLYELERRKSELQGSKGQYEAEIAKAKQTIAETEADIASDRGDFESKHASELRDAQAQIAELRKKLLTASDVASRTLITAPVAGIVTGLKYHTAGGVIQPGAPVMDIVPQDDQLVIEAQVRPNDIAQVHAGLDARIIFPAYKMRSTPKVPGKVTLVSADKFTDEHAAQPQSWYTARIEVDKEFLSRLQRPIELYPGMPAEVLISTGSRSFLSYLFRPISDSMNRAFREE
ncbi:MAG: HlyD family type I secretion periplasmic adaptor subunit [Pseudomonadota bacterium]|nr:HlyD family type I secretion periplasmic adaptor subunit [Pseudomonadota bacterium]